MCKSGTSAIQTICRDWRISASTVSPTECSLICISRGYDADLPASCAVLFLGTERFPDEAEYKTYLSRNSGSSNAYTSLAETVYHFDVAPSGLAGALSRHAQFFTSPLFTASCTEREVNAVDSEFRRNLQLDARRLFQLGKATSSRENGAVYWKFGTGSKETLWEEPRAKGENVRERLISWYRAHYSANLMNLVVLSSRKGDPHWRPEQRGCH